MGALLQLELRLCAPLKNISRHSARTALKACGEQRRRLSTTITRCHWDAFIFPRLALLSHMNFRQVFQGPSSPSILPAPLPLVSRLSLPTFADLRQFIVLTVVGNRTLSVIGTKLYGLSSCSACKPYARYFRRLKCTRCPIHYLCRAFLEQRFLSTSHSSTLDTECEDSPTDVPDQGDVEMVSGDGTTVRKGTAAGDNEAGEEEEGSRVLSSRRSKRADFLFLSLAAKTTVTPLECAYLYC